MACRCRTPLRRIAENSSGLDEMSFWWRAPVVHLCKMRPARRKAVQHWSKVSVPKVPGPVVCVAAERRKKPKLPASTQTQAPPQWCCVTHRADTGSSQGDASNNLSASPQSFGAVRAAGARHPIHVARNGLFPASCQMISGLRGDTRKPRDGGCARYRRSGAACLASPRAAPQRPCRSILTMSGSRRATLLGCPRRAVPARWTVSAMAPILGRLIGVDINNFGSGVGLGPDRRNLDGARGVMLPRLFGIPRNRKASRRIFDSGLIASAARNRPNLGRFVQFNPFGDIIGPHPVS
jgi:hypothetical protein